jgi:hypothetical protein
MADNSWYSFSEPLNRGIDFYQADSNDVVVYADASVSLTISATLIKNAAIALSSSSSLNVNAIKISYAAASLSASGAALTIATERQDSSVVMSAEVLMAVNIVKIAYSSATTSVESNASFNVTKIAYASSALSISSNTQTTITKFSYARSALSASVTTFSVVARKIVHAASNIQSGIVNFTVAGKINLATIRVNLENFGSLSVNAIKFATSGIVDSSIIRTFMLIDDKPITNHNRIFESGLEPIFVENKNWNNAKSRYYKSTSRAGRRTFSIAWTWLPNSKAQTVDNKLARDYIKQIAADPSHHVLKIVNLDESGSTPATETSYNVLVKDYNESLIRRDLSNDVYFWDCSITLEEV